MIDIPIPQGNIKKNIPYADREFFNMLEARDNYSILITELCNVNTVQTKSSMGTTNESVSDVDIF